MPTVVIIPIKSFRLGKQRLSDALDDRRRQTLGRALAGHTARAVESAGLIPLIVTADPHVAEWATMSGFPSLPDSGEGLSAAANLGVEWARASNSRWIVLHGDLPLLSASDVGAVDGVVTTGHGAIAPSSDGGTSAIGSEGDFSFAFGVGSFHRHLPRLADARVVMRSGLALDVDSPNDLVAAASTARGTWLREILW
ncbi:MAG TPA: 2-phospho-L-lactate guanylyltransferase [Acidimicrobiia bacterium]